MKKLLFVLLIALCLVSCSDKVAESSDDNIHAQYFTGSTQRINENDLYIITMIDGIVGALPDTLIVPKYVDGNKVDGLAMGAFKTYAIQKVYVPETLSYIHNFVLFKSNVVEIEVPAALDTFNHYSSTVTTY